MRRAPGRLIAALLGGAVLMAGASAWAGERIVITGSTNAEDKVSLPKDLTPSPLDSLRRSIPSGESGPNVVLPLPNPPMMIPTRKLDEMLSKKRNWIFESPNSLDREQNLEESFGVRKYEFDEIGKKPKSAEDRYFEGVKETEKSSRPDGDDLIGGGSKKRNQPEGTVGLSGQEDEKEGRGIIPELNPAALFNWTGPADPFSQVNNMLRGNSILPANLGQPGLSDRTGTVQPAREPGQSARDFDKLMGVSKAPLGRFTDPINEGGDATRSILNPIAARQTSVPPPSSSPGSLGRIGDGFPTSATASISTRPDPFGAGRDRFGSAASFAPVAVAPSASFARPQNKPAVLEIPRPKF